MPASIGVNLRVTGHCSQGGRKYMEDLFSVAYQQTEDERDLEYAFFGIYDGHGGSEAAAFAKEHLMDSIVKQRQFWSDDDEDVLKAIRNGYMLTHMNMWKELEKWPKTVTGLPSTAGTTASVAFIRRGKIYIGHVGDSAIVLGYQKDDCDEWAAKPLTSDHKPESTIEMDRILRCGGKVISKAGVPRVVWNRPRLGHKGPIKKNTPMDEIPFLAVARSLGDLWSYNAQNDEFIVSPDPDVGVLTIDPSKFRCLIFGTDGLWNMISPEGAVSLVQATERHNEAALVGGTENQPRDWLNPSKSLVDHALERWSNTRMRADNTSVVTLMLDPPGPPRATVLRSRTNTQKPHSNVPSAPMPTAGAPTATPVKTDENKNTEPDNRPVPETGLTIMTRYEEDKTTAPDTPQRSPLPPCTSLAGRTSLPPVNDERVEENNDTISNYGNPAESYFMARLLNRSHVVNTLSDVFGEIFTCVVAKEESAKEASPPPTVVPESPSETEPVPAPEERKQGSEQNKDDDGRIQINEVSSSSPVEAPKPRNRKPPPPPHDRVLRSHDAEQRPHTRQAVRRPPVEKVVILSRKQQQPAEDADARKTRSSQGGAAGGRTTRAGNCGRAGTGAGRPRAEHKENVAGGRRGAPEPVHSTTGCAPRRAPAPPPPSHRALRSRNEAETTATPTKRTREEQPLEAKAKTPKLSTERVARALGKRSSGPWAPALALRNRLRRRLAK